MTEAEFYGAVAALLGSEQAYKAYPYSKRTRWNNRTGGNGRYPGFGLVRRFSETLIHVSLTAPRLSGVYTSESAVLDGIRKAVEAEALKGD